MGALKTWTKPPAVTVLLHLGRVCDLHMQEKQKKGSWLVLSGGEAIIILHYSTHLEPINLFYLLIRAQQWAQLFYVRGDAGDHLLVS